jgi:hypothetical protein
VNLLDENVPLDQRDLLLSWRIRCRVIGQDIAQLGIADDNIVVLLHRLKRPTLFTRDEHFFKRTLCHGSYGLVWLDVMPEESALFVRRVLRHPRFRTIASRMGVVLRAHHAGIEFWHRQRPTIQRTGWIDRY